MTARAHRSTASGRRQPAASTKAQRVAAKRDLLCEAAIAFAPIRDLAVGPGAAVVSRYAPAGEVVLALFDACSNYARAVRGVRGGRKP